MFDIKNKNTPFAHVLSFTLTTIELLLWTSHARKNVWIIIIYYFVLKPHTATHAAPGALICKVIKTPRFAPGILFSNAGCSFKGFLPKRMSRKAFSKQDKENIDNGNEITDNDDGSKAQQL